MFVVEEYCLAGKGRVVDLWGHKGSYSLTVSWAFTPALLVWGQLAGSSLELPETNCCEIKFWFFKSFNGLSVTLSLFLIREVFTFKDMLSILILEGSMWEKSNKSFDTLYYNIFTFCFILSTSKLVSYRCLFSGYPALTPKQLTTACFPSRCWSQTSGERASPSTKCR